MKSTKIIIAAYPSVYPERCEKLLPSIVDYLDSDNYHVINNQINPIWPDNYVDIIKRVTFETDGLIDFKDLEYILIDTHKEVLSNLRKYHIPFIIAIPEDEDSSVFNQYQMPIIRTHRFYELSDILNHIPSYKYMKSKLEDVERYVFDAEEEPDDYATEVLNFMSKIGGNNL